MTLPLLSGKLTYKHALAAVALAGASASASALPSFTWDPSAAGLDGTAFTADNLLISNYATVTFASDGTFTESGYLAISAAQLGGTAVSAGGLDSTYGLYIKYEGSGTMTSSNTDPSAGVTTGALSSLTYTLYGYNTSGVATTYTYNTATGSFVENASGEVALATGTLDSGTVATIPATGTTFNPSANASLNIDWLVSGFATPTYALALTSFSNTTSQVTLTANGFIISQGGGSINFTSAVPEPASYAMLISGLAAVGFVARRRRRGEK